MITLIMHYFRRSFLGGLAATVALFGFQVAVAYVFQQIQNTGGSEGMARSMPKWLQTAFSIDAVKITQFRGFLTVAYQHPFVLTILLALPIALITSYLTGDAERRTLALLLARPLSRLQLILSVVTVTLFWCIVAVAASAAGTLMGATRVAIGASIDLNLLLPVCLNLLALVACVAGIAALVSSLSQVRGDAVGWCLTIVLIMYVWNFLAQVWSQGIGISNYSIFHYYQPAQALLQAQSMTRHTQILAGSAALFWVFAALVFRFRSFAV